MISRLICGLDRGRGDGPCRARLVRLTDHLYRCTGEGGCNATHWRRPRSKHYPNGARVTFGWMDYRDQSQEDAEQSATHGAMWELLATLERREKMIDWYEAHATKQQGTINRLTEALQQVHRMAPGAPQGELAREALGLK